MRIILLLIFWLTSIFYDLCAQTMPEADIYLTEIDRDKKGRWMVKSPVNITNRKGYENQPYFMPDGSLMYSGQKGKYTDIYRYSVKDNTHENLTNTPTTAEYSPKLMPNNDYFTVVRVEEDTITQHLVKLPLNNKTEPPQVLLPKVVVIGYYEWLTNQAVALFLVTNPVSLHTYNFNDTLTNLITGQIGRCLQRIPQQNALSFVHKTPNGWFLKRLNLDNWDIETIIPMLEGSEDFCWRTPDEILTGKDGKLYLHNTTEAEKQRDKNLLKWELIADFTQVGITNFSRIATSPDGKRLAVTVVK
ncbi:MAG: PD40 domain-containing protein [Sphingobacteriales bacterium]|jgi:hypothetical protein|nr:PD40 domain-containing protein [Sphingobacteriales bacterium]MBL0246378.1 PD40 domain-containing protein [Sphingobacteriales bacterium]MBP9142545.1 PD40 domain-containing protein [Chitinophagales bacterium]MCC7055786.1 PD40 domain-containing protein [Chitinophagales bacterium]MDA0198521.1 hypothetical protein [Bacteroidota bacterium]